MLSAAGGLLVSAREARADEVEQALVEELQRTRVLVLWDGDAAAFATRVEMELIALGYAVERIRMGHRKPQALAELSRRAGASGVAQVRAQPSRIEVWAAEPKSKREAYRETVLPDDGDEREAALRAAELVRAALLEVGITATMVATRPVRKPREPEPPPEVHEPAMVALSTGVGFAGSPGGVSPTIHVALAGDIRIIDALSLGISIVTPGLPGIVEAPEGEAAVFASLLGADVDGVLAMSDERVGVRLGVGAAGGWLHMEGRARAPWTSGSDNVFCFLPYARIAPWLTVYESLRIIADARAAMAVPRPVVWFAGREVAEWGRPMLLGIVGIGLGL